jgi:hypothetical protein
MRKLLTVISLAALLSGCASNIKQLGSIGNYDYYRVHDQSLAGPNINVLLVAEHDCPENEPRAVTAVGGPGIGSALIGAGGTIGAATVFGGAIRPATTTTTVNGGGANAASGSTSTVNTGGTTTVTGNHNNFHPHK